MSLELEERNFDEVIKGNDVVLASFKASWCGPCRMLSGVLDKLSTDLEETNIVKIDVDKHGDLATQYGVRNLPTLIYFKDGEIVEKTTGFQSYDVIKTKLEGLKN